MFDEYAEKLKSIQADVPKVFKLVAKKGAIKAENEAKNITDKERLVDTGNYKRNWNGKQIKPQEDVYGVQLENNVEYASFLEEGHRMRNGKRWRGRFVGRQALNEAHYYCIQQLDKMTDKLFEQYHKRFTTPDS